MCRFIITFQRHQTQCELLFLIHIMTTISTDNGIVTRKAMSARVIISRVYYFLLMIYEHHTNIIRHVTKPTIHNFSSHLMFKRFADISAKIIYIECCLSNENNIFFGYDQTYHADIINKFITFQSQFHCLCLLACYGSVDWGENKYYFTRL